MQFNVMLLIFLKKWSAGTGWNSQNETRWKG